MGLYSYQELIPELMRHIEAAAADGPKCSDAEKALIRERVEAIMRNHPPVSMAAAEKVGLMAHPFGPDGVRIALEAMLEHFNCDICGEPIGNARAGEGNIFNPEWMAGAGVPNYREYTRVHSACILSESDLDSIKNGEGC